MLLGEQLISITLVQKILRWQHTGFHVHSHVRAASKEEAERAGTFDVGQRVGQVFLKLG